MVLKVCVHCPFHEIGRNAESESISFCGKENCYSIYSRCISYKALEEFVQKNGIPVDMKRSALDLCYGTEL